MARLQSLEKKSDTLPITSTTTLEQVGFSMKSLILLGFFGVLAGCASGPTNDESAAPKARRTYGHSNAGSAQPERFSKLRRYQDKTVPMPVDQTGVGDPTPLEKPEVVIDYAGLQRFLRLDRGYNNLGYSERMFNTCEVGFGYSPHNGCEKKFFIVSHFQLVCRDSEGTVQYMLTEADLTPLSRRELKWSVKSAAGALLTDSEGYAQIAMISSQSQRTERLKIATENDFLYLKAGDLKRMITPKNWCN